jgi:adenylate cyclase
MCTRMPTDDASVQTFVFADLAGYTALTEAHGDEEAADAASDFFATVRSLLPDHDAEELKVIGDAVLLRVPDAAKAAGLAERIVCEHGTRHRALGVRVGMHTGSAVRRGGDWFGSALNIASRVADLADAGDVLCSGVTKQALGPAVPLRARGAHRFKNLVEPIAVYEFVLSQRAGRLPVDPVCRMGVDPAHAVEQRTVDGADYCFCSERCAAAFDGNPRAYVPLR